MQYIFCRCDMERKRRRIRRVKYWELIADRLSKAGWSWGVFQRLIPTGERFGLLMYTATTGGVSSFTPTKNSARMKRVTRAWYISEQYWTDDAGPKTPRIRANGATSTDKITQQ